MSSDTNVLPSPLGGESWGEGPQPTTSDVDNIAIRVSNLSKCYTLYDTPRDRLKQFVLPRLQRVVGKPLQNYYREFWALKNVSFEVRRGETVGIIGCNGSGKSTLLQIICGTLSPTSGYLDTSGRVAALLELGAGFNPEFSGRDNIYLSAALSGHTRSEINDRLDDILAFADIGEHIDQPIKTYSTGMFVRLAFSVQANLDPEVLVVDEVLAVGDALFQKRCYERIEGLISRGTTLLFVSHDEEAVRTLTNRAILLNQGKVAAIGSSAAVLLEYRRQMHEQEKLYLLNNAKRLSIKSTSKAPRLSNTTFRKNQKPHSDKLSFGDLEAEILHVHVFGASEAEKQVFYPGERLRVVVTCIAHQTLAHLNVAVRIRNKEGVKIYSWGTLNQDMAMLARGSIEPTVWEKEFTSEKVFSVTFECDCNLGVNVYEVQASISQEGKPYYSEQRMLHWRDEAAFFQVTTKIRQYHFGGVADLRMRATLLED